MDLTLGGSQVVDVQIYDYLLTQVFSQVVDYHNYLFRNKKVVTLPNRVSLHFSLETEGRWVAPGFLWGLWGVARENPTVFADFKVYL